MTSLKEKISSSLVYLCGINEPDKQWPAAEAHAEIVLDMVREEVEKIGEEVGRNHYDGSDLGTAEHYYGISAANWTEAIRLEEGYKMALDDIKQILK